MTVKSIRLLFGGSGPGSAVVNDFLSPLKSSEVSFAHLFKSVMAFWILFSTLGTR